MRDGTRTLRGTVPFNFTTNVISANTTLFAKWAEGAASYTVRFDTGVENLSVPSQTVKSGQKPKLPDNPVREDYAFSGWHKDAEGTVFF